jgi:bacillopeptidase F
MTGQIPWEQTDIDSHTGAFCWHDSIAGNYANSIDTSLTSETIDLSGESYALLSFWHHYDVQPWDDLLLIGDRADVEISTDGGITWPTRLTRYGGSQFGWIEETIDISAYVGESNVKIRFRLRTDNSIQQDGWYIDDVIIQM